MQEFKKENTHIFFPCAKKIVTKTFLENARSQNAS